MNTEIVAQQKEDKLEKPLEYIPYGAADRIKLTLNIIKNIIAVPTKTGKTCSDRDATRFMMLCQAKRLNPFEGDCFLVGYDSQDGPTFSLITAHQAYLKRAEIHPEFDGMKSGLIIREEDSIKETEGDFHLDSQEVLGGWATVFFKTRKIPTTRKLRLSRFRKPFGVWKDDPAGMIAKCAEADALRSSFPTMLGGLYMREELDLVDGGGHELNMLALSEPDKKQPRFGGRKKEELKPEDPKPVEQPQSSNVATSAATSSQSTPSSSTASSSSAPGADKKESKKGSTPQERLQKLCVGQMLSWETFRKWGIETGEVDAAAQNWTDLSASEAMAFIDRFDEILPQLQVLTEGGN